MVRDDKTTKALRKVADGIQDMIHGLCDAREGLDEKRAEWLASVEKIRRDANKQILLFIGSFSAGKSTLLNALLGDNLLPTASSPCTPVATEINLTRGGGHRGRIVEFNGQTTGEKDYGELVKAMVDNSNGGAFLQAHHLELFIDLDLLPDQNHFLANLEKMGTRIVDCPGYDSPYFAIEEIVEEYMQKSSCTFWVSTTRQFGNADDVRRMSILNRKAQRIIPVITMSDLVDETQREQIREKFFEHLSVFFPAHKEPRFVSAHKWIEARGLRKQLDDQGATMSREEREKTRGRADSLEMDAGMQKIIKDIIWGGQSGQCTDSKLKTTLYDLAGLFKDIHKSC